MPPVEKIEEMYNQSRQQRETINSKASKNIFKKRGERDSYTTNRQSELVMNKSIERHPNSRISMPMSEMQVVPKVVKKS